MNLQMKPRSAKHEDGTNDKLIDQHRDEQGPKFRPIQGIVHIRLGFILLPRFWSTSQVHEYKEAAKQEEDSIDQNNRAPGMISDVVGPKSIQYLVPQTLEHRNNKV